MKDLLRLDRYRSLSAERSVYPGPNPDPSSVGCFIIPRKDTVLRVIAAAGMGWDHVSVSTPSRCPTWDEMERVQRLFFEDSETAFQLHVPPSEHKNCHPYCLHLWRPHGVEIPRPPSIMVAP